MKMKGKSIMKKLVSVQDISCYGQCSLTVALPILSAYGIETAILPSGILSTHTGGFTGYTYHDLTEEMPEIVKHWKKENITFDAIYTGYIGDARQFKLIKEMRSLLNDGGILVVDPAMADRGELYSALDESIVDGMKEIVKEADIILPNYTEASLLLDREYKSFMTREEVIDTVKSLASLGPNIIILTGVSYDDTRIGAVAYDKSTDTITEYLAERQNDAYHGTGDVFASVVIADILNGKELTHSVEDACEFVVDAIKATPADGSHPYGVRFEQVLFDRMNH